MKSGAGRKRKHRQQTPGEITTVRTALRYFLTNHDRILEERAQALMFLGEIEALARSQKRLTDATYRRDAYNVFSEEISQELRMLNLPHRSVYRGEHRVPVYDTRSISIEEIGGEAEGVLMAVVDSTTGLSTDKIVEMCRTIPAVRQAQLDEEVDLSTAIGISSVADLRNIVEE